MSGSSRGDGRAWRVPRLLGLVAVMIPFAYGVLRLAGKDLWYDEIRSLKECVLVGWKLTLARYVDTNNHILFSLLMNSYTRLIRQRDLGAVLASPLALRLLMAAVACGTLFYVYRLTNALTGTRRNLVGLALMTTSLPFANYMVQLRGYGFSMLFMAMALFHALQFERRPRWKHGAMLMLSTFGLLYTIPSNLYLVSGLLFLHGARTVVRFLQWRGARGAPQGAEAASDRGLRLKSSALTLGCIVFGALGAALAYLPVAGQLLRLEYLSQRPPSRFFVLTELLPSVLHGFASFQYALIACAVIGILAQVACLAGRNKRFLIPEPGRMLDLSVLLLFPFVVSLLRQDAPIDRIFVSYLPVFIALYAAGVASFLRLLGLRAGRRLAAESLAVLYCLVTFAGGTRYIQLRLRRNLTEARHDQGLLYNVYLSDAFNPGEDLLPLVEAYRRDPHPILMTDELDPLAIVNQLRSNGVDDWYPSARVTYLGPKGGRHYYQLERTLGGERKIVRHTAGYVPPENNFYFLFTALVQNDRDVNRHDRFYVVTAFPKRFEEIVRRYLPGHEAQMISERYSYTTVYRLEKSGPGGLPERYDAPGRFRETGAP